MDDSQAKRRKTEEKDLGFLTVKNEKGQEQLFVDLGKNFKLIL